MRFVIIGGNAAGMSAAARTMRKFPEWEVTVLEKTDEVSYGACGLPYYVAGVIDDIDRLRVRKPFEFISSGIDLRLNSEVLDVDFDRKQVLVRNTDLKDYNLSYDKLLIATGARPRLLPNLQIDSQYVHMLRTIQDARKLRNALEGKRADVAIIGGGAIGVELAEACILQEASSVRMFDLAKQFIFPFDVEFSDLAENELKYHDVDICLGENIVGVEEDHDKRRAVITTDKGVYHADVVVVSIGVIPNTQFLSGIEKSKNGAILTDSMMRTSVPDVYAAGDCSTTWHRILDSPAYLPLGTNANKQGRLVADIIGGKSAQFDRALGTTMLKCLRMEFAKTGLSEQEAKINSIPVDVCTVSARNHARYYPDGSQITIKLCYRRDNRVLVGAQLSGEKGSAIRIQPLATAIDRQMIVDEVGFLDLGYAPPFTSVWDAIQIAANVAR